MTREQVLERMDLAARQDRERFFRIADSLHLQPKYAEKQQELEALKQAFRDMTELAGFPNIDWPLTLPEWFPRVHFASEWKKDIYIEELLKLGAAKGASGE